MVPIQTHLVMAQAGTNETSERTKGACAPVLQLVSNTRSFWHTLPGVDNTLIGAIQDGVNEDPVNY